MNIQDLDRKMTDINQQVRNAFDHDDGVRFDKTPEWAEADRMADELNFHLEAIGANLRCEWSISYSKYILLTD